MNRQMVRISLPPSFLFPLLKALIMLALLCFTTNSCWLSAPWAPLTQDQVLSPSPLLHLKSRGELDPILSGIVDVGPDLLQFFSPLWEKFGTWDRGRLETIQGRWPGPSLVLYEVLMSQAWHWWPLGVPNIDHYMPLLLIACTSILLILSVP